MSAQATDKQRLFEAPPEIQAVLVEWEDVSPTCHRLRLRRWNEAQGSSPEVMRDGDQTTPDGSGV